MGPDRIVEGRDVGREVLFQLVDRLGAAAAQFFLFQVLEEALHHRVVIRMTFGGEGLGHTQLVNDPAEVLRGELAARSE